MSFLRPSRLSSVLVRFFAIAVVLSLPHVSLRLLHGQVSPTNNLPPCNGTAPLSTGTLCGTPSPCVFPCYPISEYGESTTIIAYSSPVCVGGGGGFNYCGPVWDLCTATFNCSYSFDQKKCVPSSVLYDPLGQPIVTYADINESLACQPTP
jgi:hypothetical protein